MIGFLLPLVLKLGVPQRFAKPIATGVLIFGAAVLLIGGFLLWDHFDDKAAVKADRSAAKAEAVSRAREADERAHGAANRQNEEVSDGNERAKAAAAGSDDPLGDGLRSLRAEKDRDRPPAGRAD
jgi:hypothetical protein